MTDRVDTIIAAATPPGRGGIGVIRVSGPKAASVCRHITGNTPLAGKARLENFYAEEGTLVDRGMVLFFPHPHSFTGEDVIELQCHGSPLVLETLIEEGVRQGARRAQPGEFSQRAFLNDKMDLAQAEAVADLISSSTNRAARAAMRSLSGEFSRLVNTLLSNMIRLRVYVEAAIDFPEEEIDFLSDGKVQKEIDDLYHSLKRLLHTADQGSLLLDGFHLVLAGEPNAGKSSLLNLLSGQDSAIVTGIPGTTRDMIRETISLDGMPLHIVDTAGLRENPDEVERIGIERARAAVARSDHALFVIDSSKPLGDIQVALGRAGLGHETEPRFTLIYNKIDLVDQVAGELDGPFGPEIHLSAVTGEGMDALKNRVKFLAGYDSAGEGIFTARKRHVEALKRVLALLEMGQRRLSEGAGELLAEELREAQQALGEITGEFTSDDLLGEIFGSFCIGK